MPTCGRSAGASRTMAIAYMALMRPGPRIATTAIARKLLTRAYHLLAASADGVFFHASLALGAKSALAFWPGLPSLIVLLAEYGGRRPASEEALLSVD